MKRVSTLGALLVGLSAHLILLFPANLLGLVAGFACYFHALGRSGTPRAGFLSGYLFGLLLAASSLYWLVDVLYVLTPGERLVGAAVLGGFLLLVALPYGLWGLVAALPSRRPVPVYAQALGLWLMQVLVHDVWLDFPWLHSGYWLAQGPFGAWLGLVGARASGLLLLHLSACLGLWSWQPRPRFQLLLAVGVFSAVLFIPVSLRPSAGARPVRVAVVALDEASAGDRERDDLELLSRYVMATRRADADWVIWPESVIRDGEASIGPLRELLSLAGRRLFAGTLLRARAGTYNTLVELGSGKPVYYKQKLVPFSEYLPGEAFRRLFAWLGVNTLKSQVIAGSGPQPPLDVDGVAVIPLICFEVAFTGLVQPDVRPAVLLNIGNESWFRSALMHRMTLAMGMARSLEYGLPLVRSVTGGYSGFFDPSSGGRWVAAPEQGSAEGRGRWLFPRPVATPYGQMNRVPLVGSARARGSGDNTAPGP
ncbi:apolipoprotein N-acyltransferase [Pyxidicoccus caerfyrddinensis]|uniref:apolipoprotein N-acyltransferase n=1 Tax=Pyxidicoccus caerfyrddinensis TaxID=2709663 RepID=UPI001F07D38D|nr:apolipoprotein N-acyltransferase [Pyxidicoccus caerfyrddinensis]